MTLKEFMTKNRISISEISGFMHVSRSIVYCWVKQSVSPSLYHSMTLAKLSKGKIKFTDLLSGKDKEKTEN